MPPRLRHDVYPSSFRPVQSGSRGIIKTGCAPQTPLRDAKIQRISPRWPVFRQPRADKQRKNKRVESYLGLCLDGGSTPPISTKKLAFFASFFVPMSLPLLTGSVPPGSCVVSLRSCIRTVRVIRGWSRNPGRRRGPGGAARRRGASARRRGPPRRASAPTRAPTGAARPWRGCTRSSAA